MPSFVNVQSPLIPDNAAYLSHIYWDSTTLRDTKGLTYSIVGSPNIQPSNAGCAFPVSSGNFSDANYWAMTAASDVLDSTGDRFGAAIFIPTSADSQNKVMISNTSGGNAGYDCWITGTTGFFSYSSFSPALQTASTANVVVLNQINVGTFWRTGNNMNVQLNGGPIAVAVAAGPEVIGTGATRLIGRYSSGGTFFIGRLIEVVEGLGPPPAPSPALWSSRLHQTVLDAAGFANAWIRP